VTPEAFRYGIDAIIALLVLILLVQMRKTQGNILLERVIALEVAILRTERAILMFIDDANSKLAALNDAIAAIPAAQPPVDPATIVPVADQTAVLNGIDAATEAAKAKAPTS
jgi:hypothetical protein